MRHAVTASLHREASPPGRARRGFTLIEVVIAVAIASTGIVILYRGLTGSLLVEERRRFYDRCTAFIDGALDQHIVEAASADGGTASGTEDGYRYQVVARPASDPQFSGTPSRPYAILVTLTCTDPRLPVSEQFTTYYCPMLKVRKPGTGGSSSGP